MTERQPTHNRDKTETQNTKNHARENDFHLNFLHMSKKSSNFARKIEITHRLWYKTTDKQHT